MKIDPYIAYLMEELKKRDRHIRELEEQLKLYQEKDNEYKQRPYRE